MKNILLFIGVFVLMQCTVAQTNRERRLFMNDYVAPEELISMSKTVPFDKAMTLFSEFSKKYLNKIVVDATNSKQPISVDVEHMYWLQAFEAVLRTNKMWYDEREEFFYVYSPADSSKEKAKVEAGGTSAGVTSAKADTMGKMLLKQRDVRISSVFFTVDVVKSLNAGINWSFFYSGDGYKTNINMPIYVGGIAVSAME